MKRALGILKSIVILHLKSLKARERWGDTLLKATQLIRGRELCLRIPNSRLLEIMGLCFASSLVHALQLETLVTEQGHSITEDD